MTKDSEDTIAAGTAGAGMMLRVWFGPRSVSFGNAEWLEVPGGPSGITGYFTAHTGQPYMDHVPNPDFVRIGADNTFSFDHASSSGWPPPWSDGTFQWVIPNRFRSAGSTSVGELGPGTVQSFAIAADGTFTVSKQGAIVSRSP
jgi:hypothetical protein